MEEHVSELQFPRLTILRPGYNIDNFTMNYVLRLFFSAACCATDKELQ